MRAAPTGGGDEGERDAPGGQDSIDPPPWSTWATFYAAVLLFLAFLIALFTWFTRAFSA
ncbi:MAG TPA: hypothetical protein VFP58_13980 [Candidatus Eisenbacteria bacterium]|nr:hypothetical protein [Candidatus Eisenbacteria bacterium]